jgi:geranylgeranyl pyrophosphate synthase
VPSDSALGQAKHSGLWLGKLDDYADLPDQLEHKMLEFVSANASHAHQASPSGAAQAAAYHLASGGQRVRARLALSAGLALGLCKPDVLCLAAAAELLHNASLVHDDLQDRDVLRHGQQAVWVKFGANVAICAGDLMLSAAYAALYGMSEVRAVPALLALMHKRVASAITGQCADFGRAVSAVDDLVAYKRIALAKSGALLSLPLELVLLASGHTAWAEQACQAGEAFSVGYQVVDDLADVQRDSESGALNIVIVLQHAGFGDQARTRARQFGLEHLDRAMALANQLPLESGALLMELSLKLHLLLLVEND